MKYYGTFSANNGSTCSMEAIEFANKKDANDTMREIALGNTFQGNSCTWSVTDENNRTVFQGSYNPGCGIRYEVKNYKQNL